jgi:hypothetical protein
MGTQQIRGCLDFSRYKSCVVIFPSQKTTKTMRLRDFSCYKSCVCQKQNKFQLKIMDKIMILVAAFTH